MELHHPIMSKLWDLRGQTKRKKRNPSLNKINVEFITLIHAKELRDMENVGTVIMGGGVE